MKKNGVLLHISSLPSNYGIGTMGRAAFEFIDRLSESGTGLWQVLPIGPTGYGDSPYQSFSAFAGNPYFIDLDILNEEGLISADELPHDASGSASRVDYGRLYLERTELLKRAYSRIGSELRAEIDAFSAENSWLCDYALFMSIKRHFGGKPWTEWPDGIRLRTDDEVEHYSDMLKENISFYCFEQYEFFKQWYAMKRYANEKGIELMGDMPIYASMDSADIWSEPDAFLLNADRRAEYVAGVPPDYFSENGQLWGNPLYDWEKQKQNGYSWWMRRIAAAKKLFDVTRIDHFIGFVRYCMIQADADDAKGGVYTRGPGVAFFEALLGRLGDVRIVAEDLGVVVKEVSELLEYTGFPGMRVLQFAFDSDEKNMHYPSNIGRNMICYTSTHDNDTTVGWWDKTDEAVKLRALAAMHKANGKTYDIAGDMIDCALATDAGCVIIPMQDWLRLGTDARMNLPSSTSGNWTWRMVSGVFTDSLAGNMRMRYAKFDRLENYK